MAGQFYTNPKNREFIKRLLLGQYCGDMVVSTATIVGNLMTITAITRFKLYRRLTNILILSLSVCDLLIGIFQMLARSLWYFKVLDFFQFMTLDIVENFLIWSSVMHLLAICTERYIAILHPLRYHDLLSPGRFLVLMGFTWLVPVCLCLINVIYTEVTKKFQTDMVIYIQMPLYFLFGSIMLFAYIRILREVFKQVKTLATLEQSEGGKWKTEIRATKTLSIVILAYFIAWGPHLISSLIQMTSPKSTLSWSYRIFHAFAYVLGMNNSAVNVFIYAWQNSEFRRAYKSLVCCKNKVEPEDRFSTQRTNTTTT